ncbi:MAG: kelch repeat-containing protein, partial [Patescibacteria group bacterium]
MVLESPAIAKPVSLFLAFVMIANLVLFAAIFYPQPVQATGLPVVDVASIAQTVAKFVWDKAKWVYEKAVAAKTAAYEVWDQFKSAHGVVAELVAATLTIAMHQVLAKLTNDIVAWINGGGKGKLRVLQDPGKFLRDALDEAGGVLMGSILNVDPRTLCDASYLKFTLAPTFAGPYAVPTFDEQVACTFSGMAAGLQRFEQDFRNGGWRAFIDLTRRENNHIGQALIIQKELEKIKAQKKEAADVELNIGKGFLSQKKCVITKAADVSWTRASDEGLPGTNYRGAVRESETITGADLVGADIEDVMKEFGYSNAEEFKGYWISFGGMVECKTVTPAEQISELASKALQAPMKRLEDSITAMTNKLGTGAGSVIKPYVLAIANAGLNLLVNKEIGLIKNTVFPPPKPRRTPRTPTDALAHNTQLGQSAGAVAASANDFRSFVLKSLINFSIFTNTVSQVILESDETLKRTPINKMEYAALTSAVPSGFPTGDFLGTTTLNGTVITEDYNHRGGGADNDIKNLMGFLADVQCPGTGGDVNTTATLGGTPTTFTVAHCAAPTATDPATTDRTMVSTYSAGKIFYEEAQWCGAYAQELPLDVPVEERTIKDNYQDLSTTRNSVFGFVDDIGTLRFMRFSDANAGVVGGPFASYAGPLSFDATLISTGRDANSDGVVDTAIASTSSSRPYDIEGGDLPTVAPNFSGDFLNSSGSLIATNLFPAVAEAAAAGGFAFGGYGIDGFSSRIQTIPSGAPVANLPVPLAGAEAVYYPPNDMIYIFGGRNGQGYSNRVYEFNPATRAIRQMAANLPFPTYGLTGAYLSDTQRIYLFGGKTGNNITITKVLGDYTEAPVDVVDARFSDQILEFNPITDTVTTRTDRLPTATAHASAAVGVAPQGTAGTRIYVVGGIDETRSGVSTIIAFNPGASRSEPAVSEARAHIAPARGHLAALATDASGTTIRIFGGENTYGRTDMVENFLPASDTISAGTSLSAPLSKMARSLDTRILVGGTKNYGRDPQNPDLDPPGAKLYPEGDVYYIAGTAEAVVRQQPILQKYFSPTFEGGTVGLMNIRENRAWHDPSLAVADPDISSIVHNKGDAVLLAKPFYPELMEQAQELMEKLRIIKGYHFATQNLKDYEAGIAQQTGSLPDDDPVDNNPENPSYHDSILPAPGGRCAEPAEQVWNTTTNQYDCIKRGYKGSVSDVMSRYNNLTQAYQALFAGLQDENALEAVDPDMTILSDTEQNIRRALIGERCPVTPPSATLSPDMLSKCPRLSSGEYNMARKFVFEPDDQSGSATGLTTGFATNPFTGQKSSALAGVLNLEDMTQQLQSLPPDKNLIKLIRLRQTLEQMQVPDPTTNKIRPIPVPGKEPIEPEPLTGVDIIQISIPGHENIQVWLNDTATRNKDIQQLIEAYGYTTAKEAYPEISKELDGVLDDITNQVADKLKDVFLKRMEENVEKARADAQYRLKRFVEYARDLNSSVKYEAHGLEANRLTGVGLIQKNRDQIDIDSYVLRGEAFASDPADPNLVENIIKRPGSGQPTLVNDQI